MQNRLTELEFDDSFAPTSQIDFTSAVDVATGGENEWDTVSNKTKYFNNDPCSLIPTTKLPLEDMDQRLCGVSSVNSGHEDFEETGVTHEMGPNYVSNLSYHHSYSGDYFTLGNRGNIP